MKTIRILVLGILVSPAAGAGQDMEALFFEANNLYRENRYSEALAGYEQIIAAGYESGVVYYNMGNCCYKLQEIGRAVLFYERAKRLMPGDEDVLENLALANVAVVDKIESQPDFVLFRIVRAAVHLIPQRILVGLVLGTYLVFVLLLILWIVARREGFRRFSVRMGAVFGVLFLLFAVFLAGQWRDRSTRTEAVIMADRVDAMSAPGGDGIEVFTLHEGTKVRLDQESGDWVEIILPDRKVGWVRREAFEVI